MNTYQSNKITEFRDKFIENNKEKYNKKELLILSKVLINIKFKNCVYNKNVYNKVSSYL